MMKSPKNIQKQSPKVHDANDEGQMINYPTDE